jgi:hypothetical protein
VALLVLIPVASSQAPVDVPIPVEYINSSPEHVAQDMDQYGLKVVEKLSLKEFESRLRRARSANRPAPQLLEARYRAKLVDSALVGNGEWQARYAGNDPAILSLMSLNLALREPRVGNKAALLAEFEGPNAGLLLDGPGTHPVTFDWSARGEPGPEGIHFLLRAPPCAIATLELTLPEDRVLVGEGVAITGPPETEAAGLWKVSFARRPSLDLTIKPRPVATDEPVVVVRKLDTNQRLTPDAVEASFTFDVEVTRGVVRTLTFDCDSALRPFEVVAPGLESWKSPPDVLPDASFPLTVALHAPLNEGRVVVRCIAPLAGKVGESLPWSSPGMRLRGAVPRGETLTLLVNPEVTLDAWQPGGFRLNGSRSTAEGLELRLVGGLLDEAESAKPRPMARPSARVRARGTDFRARQWARWSLLEPERPRLRAQIEYEVLHGRLYRLNLELPADYEVERVEVTPASQRRGWEVRNEHGRPMLVVDLEQPLVASRELPRGLPLMPDIPALTLSVDLRYRLSRPDAPLAWAFPDVIPIGARLREGGLGIDYDPQRYAAVPVGVKALSALPEEGSWGKEPPPDLFYPYRGQGVRGRLELRALPPRLRASASTSVVLAPGRGGAETTVVLQAEEGAPSTVDVFLSAPTAGAWVWKANETDNSVVSFEHLPAVDAAMRLSVFAARDPLGAAALLAAPSRGEWRRLTLSRPLGPRERLTLRVAFALVQTADGRWDVPLLSVPDAVRGDGEVVLHLAGADLVRVDGIGLREAPSGTSPRAAPWRTFRYGPAPAGLTLVSQSPAADRSSEAVLDRAELIMTVPREGHPECYFRFESRGWIQPTLPLVLPAGSVVRAVCVDGYWIEGVSMSDMADRAVRVDLPVPADSATAGSGHRFEVLYTTADGPWKVWTDVTDPSPLLPAPPLSLHRTWRLPPGAAPLSDHRLRPFQSSAEGTSSLPSGYLSFLARPNNAGDGGVRQKERLITAARAVQAGSGREQTFGEALERLTLDQLAETDTLVVDATALDEAGVTPGTHLPRSASVPFWESLDLAYVPCRAAPLLTTRRQRDSWAAAGALPAAIEYAVAQSTASGAEPSGRFRRAANWLRLSAASTRSAIRPTIAAPLLSPGWTEWETVEGSREGDLLVVREDISLPAGLVLAALLFVVLVRARKGPVRVRLVFLLVWLGLSGAGYLWLPASVRALAGPSLLFVVLVGGCWYFWVAVRGLPASKSPSTRRSGLRGAAVASLILGLGVIGLIARAAPPVPAAPVVLIVEEEGHDEATAVVARDFLTRVDRLAAGIPHGGVILSANYQASVDGESVLFVADLTVHNFEEGPTTLALPFAGVRLQDDGLLDGARAYVVSAPVAQGGFVVKVEKPGDHTLRLRFSVGVLSTGAEREVQFSAPRIPQCRVTMNEPTGATFFQAPARQGSLSREAGVVERGVPARFVIEQGRGGGPILLRWRQDEPTATAPQIQVREAYLWDLRPDAAILSAVLRYSVTRGAPTSFAIDLPESLEPQGVKAQPMPGRTLPPLKSWRVSEDHSWWLPQGTSHRRLWVEFTAPVSGVFYLLPDFVPRRPLGPLPTLVLPDPVGAVHEMAFFAYRAEGVQARVERPGRLTGALPPTTVPYRTFVDLWLAGRDAPPTPTAVYTAQRDPGGAPFLQLQLGLESRSAKGTQEIKWTIGQRQAEMNAVVRLVEGEPPLLEWEVPTDVTVTGVGPRDAVRYWSQSGNRVQAWLSRSPSGVDLRITGWKDLTPEKEGARFDLPRVRLVSPAVPTTALRLSVPAELALTPVEIGTLVALPDAPAGERELSYSPRVPQYGGRFLIRPATATASVRMFTAFEVRDRQLTFATQVECRPLKGEYRRVQVRLRRWDGDPILTAPAPGQLREAPRVPGERTWVIEFPKPLTGSYQFTLAGHLPIDESAGIITPEIAIVGVAHPQHWIAVGGRELTAEGAEGLRTVSPNDRETADLPETWRKEIDRLRIDGGGLWRAEQDAWTLHLIPRLRSAESAAVRVFLTERLSVLVDRRRWGHVADYWLYHEAGTDLNVKLPPDASVVSVSVDGTAVTPLQSSANNLWIPLPGIAGARRVRLRWQYADGESLTRPRVQSPVIDQAGPREGVVLWTIRIPTGYESVLPPKENRAPLRVSSVAAFGLARAEAQYRLSQSLAEASQSGAPLSADAFRAAQQRFFSAIRHAEYERHLGSAVAADDSFAGQSFDEWLQDLQKKNRQLGQTFKVVEPLQAEGEKLARSGAPLPTDDPGDGPELAGVVMIGGPADGGLPVRGVALRWQGRPEVGSPDLTLVSASETTRWQSIELTFLLALVLLVAWVLSSRPTLRVWVQAFWPEQLALLGCLGWQILGTSPLPLALVVVGLSARLLSLVRRGVARLASSQPSGTSANGAVASADPRPSGQ